MSRHSAPVTLVVMLVLCLAASATAQTTMPSERGTGQGRPGIGGSSWDARGPWAPWGPWGTNNPRCAPFWRAQAPEVSPYDKAAAAADRRSFPGNAQGAPPSGARGSGQESGSNVTLNRPSVGERQWSTDPNSPYFRAQQRAFERPGVVQDPNAGTGYEVSAFASVPDECVGVMPWMMFDPTGFGMYGMWDRPYGRSLPPGRGTAGSTLHTPKKGRGGKR
jgi:hypothetical protein